MKATQFSDRSLDFDQIEVLIERAESLVLAARTLPPAERLRQLAEARALEQTARAALASWCTRRLLARIAG